MNRCQLISAWYLYSFQYNFIYTLCKESQYGKLSPNASFSDQTKKCIKKTGVVIIN